MTFDMHSGGGTGGISDVEFRIWISRQNQDNGLKEKDLYTLYLVDRGKKGDENAIVQLLEEYRKTIENASPCLPDALCQDVYIAIEKDFTEKNKLAKFDPALGSFATWIGRIAHNEKINEIKKKQRSDSRDDMDSAYHTPALDPINLDAIHLFPIIKKNILLKQKPVHQTISFIINRYLPTNTEWGVSKKHYYSMPFSKIFGRFYGLLKYLLGDSCDELRVIRDGFFDILSMKVGDDRNWPKHDNQKSIRHLLPREILEKKIADTVLYDYTQDEGTITQWAHRLPGKTAKKIYNEAGYVQIAVSWSKGGKCKVKNRKILDNYVYVEKGDTLKVEFIPDDGYLVKSVTIDGENSGSNGELKMTDINQNHKLHCDFVKVDQPGLREALSDGQYRENPGSERHSESDMLCKSISEEIEAYVYEELSKNREKEISMHILECRDCFNLMIMIHEARLFMEALEEMLKPKTYTPLEPNESLEIKGGTDTHCAPTLVEPKCSSIEPVYPAPIAQLRNVTEKESELPEIEKRDLPFKIEPGDMGGSKLELEEILSSVTLATQELEDKANEITQALEEARMRAAEKARKEAEMVGKIIRRAFSYRTSYGVLSPLIDIWADELVRSEMSWSISGRWYILSSRKKIKKFIEDSLDRSHAGDDLFFIKESETSEPGNRNSWIEIFDRALEINKKIREREWLNQFFMVSISRSLSPGREWAIITGRVDRGYIKIGEQVEILGEDRRARGIVQKIEKYGRAAAIGLPGETITVTIRKCAKGKFLDGIVLVSKDSMKEATRFKARVYKTTEGDFDSSTLFKSGIRVESRFNKAVETGKVKLCNEGQPVSPGNIIEIEVELNKPVWIEKGSMFTILKEKEVAGVGLVTGIIDWQDR